jgi:hypothetical protein
VLLVLLTLLLLQEGCGGRSAAAVVESNCAGDVPEETQ